MTMVLGQDRLTVTSASVPVAITLRAIAAVSTRASGVPMGTSARPVMVVAIPGDTPSTLTERADQDRAELHQPHPRQQQGDHAGQPGRQQPGTTTDPRGPGGEPGPGGGQAQGTASRRSTPARDSAPAGA